MNSILIWMITILYGVIGGVSTLALVAGIPAIIFWKFYRRAALKISIID